MDVYLADFGARLSLRLGGNSTIITDYSNNASPDIMVAELGILLLRDDPDVAGVGSLTVGSEWSDGGHALACFFSVLNVRNRKNEIAAAPR